MTGRGHPASRAAEGWLPSGVTAPMCARAVGRCWEPHARPGAGTHPLEFNQDQLNPLPISPLNERLQSKVH